MRVWGPFLILFSLVYCSAISNASNRVSNEVTYVKAVYSLPVTFDPVKMNDTASLIFSELVYEGLLRLRADYGFEGALATSWSTDSSGRKITFELRRDAQFHNGETVTAHDVVASLSRAVAPGSTVFDYYSSIQGADAYRSGKAELVSGLRVISPTKLEVHLTEPFPPLMYVLAGATAKVMPRKQVSMPTFFHKPIGSGPFKFVSATNDEVMLRRFDSYSLANTNIHILKLVASDENTARKNAAVGKVHDLANWPLSGKESIFSSGQHLSAIVANTWIIGLNTRKPPFKNRSVRMAFRSSFDAEKFRLRFYPDAAPARGYIPPGFPGTRTAPYNQGPNAAKSTSKIEIAVPKGLAEEKAIKEFIESEFQKTGWNVSVKMMEWAHLMNAYQKKELQAFLLAMNVDYPDAEFLLRSFQSDNPGNFSGIKDHTIDRKLTEARRTADRMKREAIYREVADRIESFATTINLFHPRSHIWVHKCVKGLTPNLLSDVYIDYRNIIVDIECMNAKQESQ